MPKTQFSCRIEVDVLDQLASEADTRGLSRSALAEEILAAHFGVGPPAPGPAGPSLPSDKLAEDLRELREWVSSLDDRVSRLQELAGEGSY